jgi:hypothetical protein
MNEQQQCQWTLDIRQQTSAKLNERHVDTGLFNTSFDRIRNDAVPSSNNKIELTSYLVERVTSDLQNDVLVVCASSDTHIRQRSLFALEQNNVSFMRNSWRLTLRDEYGSNIDDANAFLNDHTTTTTTTTMMSVAVHDPLLQSSDRYLSSTNDDFQRTSLEQVENNERTNSRSFLDTLEQMRLEQRTRLAQVEHEYYNQRALPSDEHETIVTSKPPLPTVSKRSMSPVLATEQRARQRSQHSISTNVVRRHDDAIAFCPHRTVTGDTTTTINGLSTDYIKQHIESLRREFNIEHQRRTNK